MKKKEFSWRRGQLLAGRLMRMAPGGASAPLNSYYFTEFAFVIDSLVWAWHISNVELLERAMKRFLIISGVVVVIIAAAIVAVTAASRWQADRRHAESVQCGNYMVSIGCAARMWAWDNGGYLPSDLRSMSNELCVPEILICPGDHSRRPATSWALFTTNNSSYEIITPGLRDGDTNGVFLRCKIHGHIGYADATVFDGTRRRTKIP